jgi:hypothetical protein
MSAEPSPIESFTKDPNSLLITIGMLVWILGSYSSIVQPLLYTGGFVLTCYATAVTALKRPGTKAGPGLILGIIIHLIAGFLNAIWFLGPILSPILYVLGGSLILFFAVPMALQLGNVPIEQMIDRVKSVAEREKEEEASKGDAAETDPDTSQEPPEAEGEYSAGTTE